MSAMLPGAERAAGLPVERPDDAAREREHRAAANRAIAVSAVGLALTGAIELAIALFTGSVALLGDALHSLSDVSTSLVVFVGMGAAVIGMAGNLAVSRYKRRVARQIHSLTMEAEANHSWLDVISSLGALVGLIGVAFGYRWADPIAGLAVTLFILHVGWEVTTEIVHHLMDGVEPEHLEAARQAARGVAGVHDVAVRGRWMGRSLTLEVEGRLDSETSLQDATAPASR